MQKKMIENEFLIREWIEKYTKFLMDNGYTDTDCICEEPKAIDRFIDIESRKAEHKEKDAK